MLNQLNNPQNEFLYSQFTGQPQLQPQMAPVPQQVQQMTAYASHSQADVPSLAIYNKRDPFEPSKASTGPDT